MQFGSNIIPPAPRKPTWSGSGVTFSITAGVNKPVSPPIFRHSFATQLPQNGYDIRTIQEVLGHKDVKTTVIYTHVLQRGGMAVKSPLDA